MKRSIWHIALRLTSDDRSHSGLMSANTLCFTRHKRDMYMYMYEPWSHTAIVIPWGMQFTYYMYLYNITTICYHGYRYTKKYHSYHNYDKFHPIQKSILYVYKAINVSIISTSKIEILHYLENNSSVEQLLSDQFVVDLL